MVASGVACSAVLTRAAALPVEQVLICLVSCKWNVAVLAQLGGDSF